MWIRIQHGSISDPTLCNPNSMLCPDYEDGVLGLNKDEAEDSKIEIRKDGKE